MSDRSRWALILAGSSLLLALTMQGPQWIHSRSPLYRGIPLTFNADEQVYLARVQESLSGRPEQSAEAFTGEKGLMGTQFAFIERWIGNIFSVTGLDAAHVFIILDSVTPVLIFLSLFLFFRLCGCTRNVAFGCAVAFSIIELYNLNRPIHMRESFLLMLWALIGVSYAWIGKRWGVLLGGGLLGVLVGAYFWGFSFAWAFFGVLLSWELLEWLAMKWRKSAHAGTSLTEHIGILLLCGGVGVIAALPAIAQYFTMMAHPLYADASFRSGMHPGHMPESFPYSFLFATAAVCIAVALFRNYAALRRYRLAFTMLFAAVLYMNQQIVHGIVFNFVSHAIFSLAAAALVIIGLAVTTRNRWLFAAAIPLLIYLGAIAYDGRYVLYQWKFEENRLSDQHFADALPILDALPRARILSDPQTSAFIAGHTKHDIVYSIYLKNVLMTHGELARRFCLTLLPLASEDRGIASMEHLIFPDAVSAFGGDLRQKEELLVNEACGEIDRNPAEALKNFGVNYMLWNTVRMPAWNVERLGVPLTETSRGDGWILYAMD